MTMTLTGVAWVEVALAGTVVVMVVLAVGSLACSGTEGEGVQTASGAGPTRHPRALLLLLRGQTGQGFPPRRWHPCPGWRLHPCLHRRLQQGAIPPWAFSDGRCSVLQWE